MSDYITETSNQQTGNPPVATHRDGAISAKIWRNTGKGGAVFYAVRFQRTFTDAATGKARNAQSFSGTDLLKVQRLASQAYQTIGRLRGQDKVAGKAAENGPETDGESPAAAR